MGHAGNDRFRCLDRHANATFFFTRPMCSEISACAASAEHLKRAPPTATATVGTSARVTRAIFAQLLTAHCTRSYRRRPQLRESSKLLGRLSVGSSDARRRERQAKTGPSRLSLPPQSKACPRMPSQTRTLWRAPSRGQLKEMYASTKQCSILRVVS